MKGIMYILLILGVMGLIITFEFTFKFLIILILNLVAALFLIDVYNKYIKNGKR